MPPVTVAARLRPVLATAHWAVRQDQFPGFNKTMQEPDRRRKSAQTRASGRDFKTIKYQLPPAHKRQPAETAGARILPLVGGRDQKDNAAIFVEIVVISCASTIEVETLLVRTKWRR